MMLFVWKLEEDTTSLRRCEVVLISEMGFRMITTSFKYSIQTVKTSSTSPIIKERTQ